MTTAIELYWLPLGAGGHVVAFNGRVYEAIAARLAHRTAAPLFHAALEVWIDGVRTVIEMAPAWHDRGTEHGVVAVGPVGLRCLGRWRWFRYEIRRWRGGVIPDVAFAVDGPVRLGADPVIARRVLDAVPQVPTPVWGRDELHLGEMWNSNSVIAWVLARAGVDAAALAPPRGGRAPGWAAGLAAR
jgi:hypothetical protein